MEQKIIDINLLVENKGQINGVPGNPRKIKKERLAALEKSIKDAPEMLNLRELLVFPHNGKYIVIGGNMRLKACKKLGYTQLPCKIIDDDTPVEKLKEYIIKDNNAFGDDDFSKLKLDWNIVDLQGWGMDIDFDEKLKARCDLKPQISHVTKSGLFVLCNFRKSKKQTDATILSIKENTDNAEVFADEFILLLQKIIHAPDGWCIITAPKRRHKEMNFAEKICEIASDKTGITFYKDVFSCKNLKKIDPEFTITKNINENNIILYDDIITTGSTLLAMCQLLQDKNLICIAGINNN